MKQKLFSWVPFRFDCPNLAYLCDGWRFATKRTVVYVHGPSEAYPGSFRVSGGRKHYPTLEAAQKAALRKLRASLTKTLQDASADLLEIR